jgi:hypothetical protein
MEGERDHTALLVGNLRRQNRSTAIDDKAEGSKG